MPNRFDHGKSTWGNSIEEKPTSEISQQEIYVRNNWKESLTPYDFMIALKLNGLNNTQRICIEEKLESQWVEDWESNSGLLIGRETFRPTELSRPYSNGHSHKYIYFTHKSAISSIFSSSEPNCMQELKLCDHTMVID